MGSKGGSRFRCGRVKGEGLVVVGSQFLPILDVMNCHLSKWSQIYFNVPKCLNLDSTRP